MPFLVPISKRPDPVAALRLGGAWHLLAARSFRAGETILRLEGVVRREPSRFSIQVGSEEHLHPFDPDDFASLFERTPWCLLNHSCAPTARIEGRRLVALRALGAFEELTFHYETTEWSLAEPFVCRCGAHVEPRRVGGFAELDEAERRRIAAWTAPHLLRLLARSS